MTIWEELAADSEKGAKRLVVEYGDRLLVFAFHLTQNRADAEDLVFRTFARVVAKISQYSGRSSFYTWVCSVLINYRRMDLRRKSANMLEFVDEVPETEDIAPDPAEKFAARAETEAVRRAMAELPEALRQVLVLTYYEDFDLVTIAGMLEISVGTVKSRLHRARQKLSRILMRTEFREGASNNNGRASHPETAARK